MNAFIINIKQVSQYFQNIPEKHLIRFEKHCFALICLNLNDLLLILKGKNI